MTKYLVDFIFSFSNIFHANKSCTTVDEPFATTVKFPTSIINTAPDPVLFTEVISSQSIFVVNGFLGPLMIGICDCGAGGCVPLLFVPLTTVGLGKGSPIGGAGGGGPYGATAIPCAVKDG